MTKTWTLKMENTNMDTELRREVALQINLLGDSEYALGYSRAETKDVNSIIEAIQYERAGNGGRREQNGQE
jgi:hypothetical protein